MGVSVLFFGWTLWTFSCFLNLKAAGSPGFWRPRWLLRSEELQQGQCTSCRIGCCPVSSAGLVFFLQRRFRGFEGIEAALCVAGRFAKRVVLACESVGKQHIMPPSNDGFTGICSASDRGGANNSETELRGLVLLFSSWWKCQNKTGVWAHGSLDNVVVEFVFWIGIYSVSCLFWYNSRGGRTGCL